MASYRILLVVLASIIGVRSAGACACQGGGSACHEVALGRIVFVGTVESIGPRFLDYWSLSRQRSLREILDSDYQFRDRNSPVALDALKKRLQQVLPDLAEPVAQRLAAARTYTDVVRVFDAILNRGRTVRFHVTTVFTKGGDDEDDDADDDDLPNVLDVVTPFSECGYNFQQGESYLVYAIRDEKSDDIETDACTATKRLTDAGPDLAYLYYRKNAGKLAGHIDGSATYVPLYVPPVPTGAGKEVVKEVAKEAGKEEAKDRRAAPAGGLVIGVRSPGIVRYAISDALGKFAFDGLPPGEYAMTVWASGYPDTVKVLSGPSQFQVPAKSCIERTVAIPAPPGMNW